MKIFDYAATGARLPYPALIDAVRAIFIDGCTVPRRHIHAIDSDDAAATLLVMPAWQKNKFMGIKHVTIYPDNGKKHGLAGLHSTYTLFDANNGVPVAVIDGNQITCRRTAAASAPASSSSIRPPGKQMSPGCHVSAADRTSNRTPSLPSRRTSGTSTAERR